MKAASAKGYVALVVVAAGAFVLKRAYHGPWAALVRDYGGNLTVSFAVYFVAAIAAASVRLPKAAAAVGALLIVESFELTSGFGIMANVYDPMDLVVNAVGVGVGMLVDHGLSRWAKPCAAD